MLFVCTTTGCITENEPQGPSIKVGESLPAFSVEMNNGEVISTSSLSGKVPVIVFFNTDCSDCQRELPVIQELWEDYQSTPEVSIVLIAREESEEQIDEYWKKNNLTMPYSPQDNRDIYSLFAPSVIPRIYIADRTGKIVMAYDDSDMPSLSALKQVINSILA